MVFRITLAVLVLLSCVNAVPTVSHDTSQVQVSEEIVKISEKLPHGGVVKIEAEETVIVDHEHLKRRQHKQHRDWEKLKPICTQFWKVFEQKKHLMAEKMNQLSYVHKNESDEKKEHYKEKEHYKQVKQHDGKRYEIEEIERLIKELSEIEQFELEFQLCLELEIHLKQSQTVHHVKHKVYHDKKKYDGHSEKKNYQKKERYHEKEHKEHYHKGTDDNKERYHKENYENKKNYHEKERYQEKQSQPHYEHHEEENKKHYTRYVHRKSW